MQYTVHRQMDVPFFMSICPLNSFGYDIIDDNLVIGFKLADQPIVDAALLEYPTKKLEDFKRNRLEDLANVRRVHEVKGPMGMTADLNTKVNLLCAIVGLERKPDVLYIDWELTRGNFVQLDRVTPGVVFDAGFTHQQACFTNVKNLTEAILAVTLEEDSLEGCAEAIDRVLEVDIHSGWPVA